MHSSSCKVARDKPRYTLQTDFQKGQCREAMRGAGCGVGGSRLWWWGGGGSNVLALGWVLFPNTILPVGSLMIDVKCNVMPWYLGVFKAAVMCCVVLCYVVLCRVVLCAHCVMSVSETKGWGRRGPCVCVCVCGGGGGGGGGQDGILGAAPATQPCYTYVC